MGKTPKDKVNERRRPYNYLRNTQAQGQFSGNESRNHYYSSGIIQRQVPYVQLSAIPSQYYRRPYRGEQYRGHTSNIPKPGKPFVRKPLPSKKIVSPLKRVAKRKMQSASEEQNSHTKDSTGEQVQPQEPEEQPAQPKEEEHSLKNGPAEANNVAEDKGKMENGLAADAEEGSEKAPDQDSENLDDSKAKSVAKEKKTKKGETPSKAKGKHSPKTPKDKKSESTEVKKNEVELEEMEVETKDKKVPKKGKKDAEVDQTPQHDSPQLTVKVLRLKPDILPNAEMNDSSVVEIPVDVSEKEEVVPSTSTDWPSSSRSSPRRSTRLQEQKHHQDDSVILVQKNDQDDSILVLENESISITEVSRSRNVPFGEALVSMRGRRSLRPLPPLNLSSHRHAAELQSSLTKSQSIRTPPDQELKSRSFTSVQHKSSKSVTTITSDLAADSNLEDHANDSAAEESDATSSEPSSTTAELNASSKRKMSPEIELHEPKRFRSITEEQQGNSSGFLSIISSPMSKFASKIKSGKSSTPVHLVQVLPSAEGDESHLSEDISKIPNEEIDEKGDSFIEKSENESFESVMESPNGHQVEAPQKKWCSIM